MKDKEKFKGFKRQIVEENEAKYGAELWEKYGEDTVLASSEKAKAMSEKN